MLNLRDNNLVVLDIETSGTNPFRHEALSVALVPLVAVGPPFQIHLAHQKIEWNEFALSNFRKFEYDWKTSAVPPDVACASIEQYLRRTFAGRTATLIGHNVGFDIAFLRKIAFQGGRDEIAGISHRAIDTHTLLYLLSLEGKIPASALSSEGAFRHFHIAVSDEERHTALGDAIATRELVACVLKELVGSQQLSFAQ
jgi:DNA polymerase III subunit epsilon